MPRRTSRRRLLATPALVLSIAVACSGDDGPAAGSGDLRLVADGPVVSWASSAPGGGTDALVLGTVRIADGCVTLDLEGNVDGLVWPAGTEAADAEEVALPSGPTVGAGAMVEGGGGYAPVGMPLADAWVELAGNGCAEPVTEVAYFDRGEDVSVDSP